MVQTQASTARRRARLVVLQVLYETDAVRHDPTSILENLVDDQGLDHRAKDFARELIRGILENREEIDKIVKTFAPSWPFNQMPIVDRNVLRIAIYEMTVSRETPPKVAINEAVEMAKVFGADSSPRFVNGVLGSVMETAEL